MTYSELEYQILSLIKTFVFKNSEYLAFNLRDSLNLLDSYFDKSNSLADLINNVVFIRELFQKDLEKDPTLVDFLETLLSLLESQISTVSESKSLFPMSSEIRYNRGLTKLAEYNSLLKDNFVGSKLLLRESSDLTYYELRTFLTKMSKMADGSTKRFLDGMLATLAKMEVTNVPTPPLATLRGSSPKVFRNI